MEQPRYDIAIVGGGIVGLATALAIQTRLRPRLVVIEAEDSLAAHQTGHNSGVIHSGLYYKPGSRKARNCVEGRQALYRFCQENGITHKRCGKVVVAVRQSELPALAELERRGQANGLEGICRLGPGEIREIEPHANGIAGLAVPDTGIVNYRQVAQTIAGIVRGAGGEIRTGSRVLTVRRSGTELTVESASGEIVCRHLINCAGLRSDQVARMCGVDPGLQIVPFRGEYYELVPERRFLIRNLLYPVPDPRFPFLGVHFTRMIQGGVEAGPNAVLALAREGYSWTQLSLGDCLKLASFAGFWRLAGRHWKTGLTECYRSLSKQAFVRALQKLVPELRPEDIRPRGAGVRAQAVLPSGVLLDDFHILEANGMIHVLNAPSPAATACLTIGQTIADLAEKNFDLRSATL